MAYFYGWTDSYIMSLSLDTFFSYYNSIDVIESQEQLKSISSNISSVQKSTALKEKVNKLNLKIKSAFKVKISSKNAKYIAEEMLKNVK